MVVYAGNTNPQHHQKEPPQIRGDPLSQFLRCFSHFVCEAEADNDGDEDNWDAMQS